MVKSNLKIVTWKEGKHFVAQCLNVDVSSFGKTRIEAIKNLREALELYLEDGRVSNLTKIDDPVISTEQLQHA